MLVVKITELCYWTSDQAYARLMNLGLPVLGTVAGVVGAPLAILLMLSLPAALLAPPIWAMRHYWRATLAQRMDLARGMVVAVVATLVLYAGGALFTFYVLGAVLRNMLSGPGYGLSTAQVLPYGLASCCLFLTFRLLRRWTLGKMPVWIKQADQLRAGALAEVENQLDPRLLQRTLTLGRPN